ncbi:MAG: 3-deoxy-manno-octulosonate cytidylyltransferase [Phycisphaeraceae bacterium]|nr:3-deoxy-manno-octulosonate cytidylyltransferase [Phycisphaeraceae bacterium]
MPGERVVAIIPARFASERFPGKMLAAETGTPLIVHVARAVGAAASVVRVAVATDHASIANVLGGSDVEVVMTRVDHENGTSRLDEAAGRLGLSPTDIVVNVQGDEPEIEGAAIDAAVAALRSGSCPMSTLACPIRDEADRVNPNIVKVVTSLHGRALYFSRAPIPHPRQGECGSGVGALRHIGLYAYRREFLSRYVSWPATPLESIERLEQLRVLEHGEEIAVAMVDHSPEGIDTPEQYRRFVERWRARQGGP